MTQSDIDIAEGYVAIDFFSAGDGLIGHTPRPYPGVRMRYAGASVSCAEARQQTENYNRCLHALSILLDCPYGWLAARCRQFPESEL